MAFRVPLGWSGNHPFFLSKEETLRSRGLLRPDIWHDVHLLACDRKATVMHVAGFRSRRVEIMNQGVVIVVADHSGCGVPVILTAFIPGDPVFPAGVIKDAARRVDVTQLVNLDARLRSEA